MLALLLCVYHGRENKHAMSRRGWLAQTIPISFPKQHLSHNFSKSIQISIRTVADRTKKALHLFLIACHEACVARSAVTMMIWWHARAPCMLLARKTDRPLEEKGHKKRGKRRDRACASRSGPWETFPSMFTPHTHTQAFEMREAKAHIASWENDTTHCTNSQELRWIGGHGLRLNHCCQQEDPWQLLDWQFVFGHKNPFVWLTKCFR